VSGAAGQRDSGAGRRADGQTGGRAVLAWLGSFLGLALIMTGCQERLTAPGQCPELCPGGNAEVFDTVLNPTPGLDSSASGYVARGGGTALLVSNGLPASEDRAVYRFQAREDSIEVRDTMRAYTVDSVLISLNLVARDTLVDGLKLFLYRISPSVDIDTPFATINGEMTEANLVDSIDVPDSVNTGPVLSILRGADADRVSLPVGTGGVLAIAVGMHANAPSGVRLPAGTSVATFISYVTVDVPDTGSLRHQTVTRNVGFNTFVTENPVVPDPNLLTIGGEPSSRAFIPFQLPPRIRDSATIVRATLELLPATTLLGLPTDLAFLEARPILADLGPKSPVSDNPAFVVTDTLPVGTSDTVRIDVTSIVQLWQTSSDLPQTVSIKLLPEGASFTRAVFGSTRSATVGAPRLRISYMLSFPFENP
jgi:hypothetical protein